MHSNAHSSIQTVYARSEAGYVGRNLPSADQRLDINGLVWGFAEEIGSPASQYVITAEAEKARLAFNSEPSRPSGNIVTRRKGGIFCRCEISGVAAHSGGFFEDGRSAIEELARKVQALHALTDLEKGITINVGLVSGGQSVNTVAAHAECGVDIRYREVSDREAILSKVQKICEQAQQSSQGIFVQMIEAVLKYDEGDISDIEIRDETFLKS